MADQLDLFAPGRRLPEGFRYEEELISPQYEQALVAEIRKLPFEDFEFHGYIGKRRTVSFGWAYDFNSEGLHAADRVSDPARSEWEHSIPPVDSPRFSVTYRSIR